MWNKFMKIPIRINLVVEKIPLNSFQTNIVNEVFNAWTHMLYRNAVRVQYIGSVCILCVWKQADLPRIDSLIFISFQWTKIAHLLFVVLPLGMYDRVHCTLHIFMYTYAQTHAYERKFEAIAKTNTNNQESTYKHANTWATRTIAILNVVHTATNARRAHFQSSREKKKHTAAATATTTGSAREHTKRESESYTPSYPIVFIWLRKYTIWFENIMRSKYIHIALSSAEALTTQNDLS